MKDLFEIIEEEGRKKRPAPKIMMINFVKEGQHLPKKAKNTIYYRESQRVGIISRSEEELVFPNVIQTTLRPDIFGLLKKAKP